MKWTSAFLLCLAFTPIAHSSINEAWEQTSDPATMAPFYKKVFADLPLRGQVTSKTRYWAGDFWPYVKGGINYRWFAKNKIGFNLNSPDRDRALRMTIPELAELSPAEKFDLFLGRYDYPLRNEVAKTTDPKVEPWEGICHGQAPASMNHNEPEPKLMTNPDGIDVPFGSADIKALVSYYYAVLYTAPTNYQVGRRCFKSPTMEKDKDCNEDLNAGAFHLILTNKVGIEGKTFIADLERFDPVRNHPIISYQTQVNREISPDKLTAPGAVKSVEVTTTVVFVMGAGLDWSPVIGTSKQEVEAATYQYRIDIDNAGAIIGGNWISKERPDFLWLVARPRAFTGGFARLPELLNDQK